MHHRVPSHPERRPRGVARTLAAVLLAFIFPPASFAQAPNVNWVNVVPTFFNALASAEVTSDGGAPITERGFVYSYTADNDAPVLGGPWVYRVTVPGTLGALNRTIPNLSPGQNYSIRAYATNQNDTGYSEVEAFATPCPARVFPNIPSGSLGTSYGASVQALGGVGWWENYGISVGAPAGVFVDTWGGYLYGTPTETGTFNFTVSLIDNYGCTASRNYSLRIDALHVVPTKVAFASELVDATSPAKTVTIVNNGASDVNLSLPLTASGPFQVSPANISCSDPLPANGGSCTVDLTYTPPDQGVHTGAMSIGHNVGGSPAIVVSLRGAGTTSLVPHVYVSNTDNATVSAIDPVTDTVRLTIPVENWPGNLAALPGGGKLYVPNRNSNSVSVISTDSNTVLKTIYDARFNSPYAVAPTPFGDEVWVVNGSKFGEWAVSIIRTSDDTVIAAIPYDSGGCVQSPEGIAANPRNHEMYVFSRDNEALCVFDRTTRSPTRSFLIGGAVEHGVVLPNGTAVYVNDGPAGAVTRIAMPSGVVTRIANADGHNMDVSADGSKVYIGREDKGFGYINTATNTFVNIPLPDLGSAYGVAVHDAAGKVYVTDEDQHRVHVVDLATDVPLPNPELPIDDDSFSGTRAIASIKAAAPLLGEAPTVTTLANGVPSFVAATVSADVTEDGGLAIFERGFAYSDSAVDQTPEPGEPGVLVAPVGGGLGPMGATLTGLTPGATYYYQAYAKNLAGTGYAGPPGSFTTQSCAAIGISDPASLPNGFEGVAYGPVTFTVTGSASFAVSYTNLPPGLTGSGVTLSGTPTAGAAGDIVVRVTDIPTGCFAEATYPLMVGSVAAPGDLVISEFRTRGIYGEFDEYVEIGNRTNSKVVVLAQDGSDGWSIGNVSGTVATIPNGTVIEKGGHWLAVGAGFSLWDYGAPDQLCREWESFPTACNVGADAWLASPLADDFGIALFSTADPEAYAAGTRLDSVGGALEEDALFFEGEKLPALGTADPLYQTAWVRQLTNSAILKDDNENGGGTRPDFILVATDAGNYGPTGEVPAMLGGPNPEDSYTVRDVLNAELPVSLLDPNRGPQQNPNRDVQAWSERIHYRRFFTNNTGADIGTLAFKVINLTTYNSRQTLAVQGDLRVRTAFDDAVWVETENESIDTRGAILDSESMYPLTGGGWPLGGVNSRLVVPLEPSQSEQAQIRPRAFGQCNVFAHGERLPVNFRLYIASPGYYLYILVPQISLLDSGPPKRLAALVPGRERSLCGGGGGGGGNLEVSRSR